MVLLPEMRFDEVREEIEPLLKKLDEGGSTLEANPEMEAPLYWEGVDFHRTAGGWDEHDYQGFIHADIVHSRLVNKNFPGGIFKQRKMISEVPPKDHYDRILDMGCSTGHFTRALAETYPDAEIHGVDLSLRTLEQARRLANANGWSWHLYQRPAEDTKFDRCEFRSGDILHHAARNSCRRREGRFCRSFPRSEAGRRYDYERRHAIC